MKIMMRLLLLIKMADHAQEGPDYDNDAHNEEDDDEVVVVVVEKDDDEQEGPDNDRLVDGDRGGLGGVPLAKGHRQCLRMLSGTDHD